MKHLSIMIKPASSLCNLRCRYCFYADVASSRDVRSFGVMEDTALESMLRNIRASLAPGDHIQFAFQGGEPTLAGLDYFRRFTGITGGWTDISVTYALQTNAITLDGQWADYLRQHRYLVGVSLDILPECHNACRVDAAGKGTYAAVLGSIRLLEKFGVEYNVLCTLTAQAARHPVQMWNRIRELGLSHVQFTPCLGELEGGDGSPYALTPRRFADFYNTLFRLWYADFSAGKYRSIKFFDDVVNLMAYGHPTSCGMNGVCQPQIVVEANGNVYPCDFYCLDTWCLGNLAEQPLEEILGSPLGERFRNRPHTRPALCGDCPFHTFCGGGCKRMQAQICCSGSDTWCGYRAFLEANVRELSAIAARQRQYRFR